ncbi:hypothetical protein ACFSTH_17375 [Paenibacillus yanchengensis]|uniref:Pentapeptide repeat-containing protein n=1 Tax=Paenibacillus yanchengensis TaxID=2035833 RepID=A0ABW4YQG2_9BACL
MEIIENEHFENETISFDGFTFQNCSFRKCVIFIQTLDFNFKRCSFTESMLYVDPSLPILDIHFRLNQSTYDKTTHCIRKDCQYPRTLLQLPTH